jgi:membrane-bound serine protease (ClpP class)
MDYLTIALILIAVGVILLGAEILLPTGGLLVVGALLCFAAGVGTILYYGDEIEAAVAIVGLAIGLPLAGFVAVHAWRRLSIGSALDSGFADASAINPQQAAELEALKGRVGKTVSPLRPSGTAEFDGRRLDAMTEGMMLDAGVWVRCVGVRGTSLVVREMEPPSDVSDINLDEPRPAQPVVDDLDLGLEGERGA